MAHSIELLVDPATDAAVRRMWTVLQDAGLPSQGTIRSESNRPHITLIAAQHIDSDVDAAAILLADRLPITVEIGASLVFRGERSTVALLVVPTGELLALQADVVDCVRPFVTGPVLSHCEPDAWTPHITLARRVTDEQIGPCITYAGRSAYTDGAPSTATIVGLRRWDSDARATTDLVRVEA